MNQIFINNLVKLDSYNFADSIFRVHMKDIHWSDVPKDIGVFGGYITFGDHRRNLNFRSIGRGRVVFESIIRALNDIGYNGIPFCGMGRQRNGQGIWCQGIL